MKKKYLIKALIKYWLLALPFIAHNVVAQQQLSTLEVHEGYIRASIPGSTISSAYMTITNNSEKTVTFLGVSSKISSRIEIHQHTMLDGVMRMRQLESITIKSHDSVVLQPSGLHLMIFDVNGMLEPEEIVDLTLHFSDQKELSIQLPVYSIKQYQNHHRSGQ